MERTKKKIVGLVVGIVLVLSFIVVAGVKNFKEVPKLPNPSTFVSVSPEVMSLQNAFVSVSKAVRPSVVQITTEKTITYRYWDPFGDIEDFFNFPFDNFFSIPKRNQQPKTFKKKQEGLGSGFIVDPDGYILTNNHVIEGVDRVLVKLFDDENKYPAKIIGTDPKTDLALIKIDVKRALPSVVLGDSDTIQVGEWAIAIGNPMGLTETVTVGVISATGRSGFGITQYEDFIQTDAAINPGNSGGPLVNIKGEVIGINTFIITPYAAQNIGFAIPINIAKSVFKQLKEKGKVVRGYLGIVLQPLTDDLSKSFGLNNTKGAVVAQVMSNSPAEKGGLKVGDVIVEFDGQKIEDVKDLQMKVANTPVGKKVKVGIFRDGKAITLEVQVGEMPEEEKVAKTEEEQSGLWFGMKVSEITDQIANKYGLENKEGVIVVYVEQGSVADENGIIPGSVIKKIDKYTITNYADFLEAKKNVNSKQYISVWIVINGQGRFVVLKKSE